MNHKEITNNGKNAGIRSAKPGQPLAEGITRKKIERILVVDDDPSIRDTMQRILKKTMCYVEVAENAEAALLKLKEGKFDLILSDFEMPGMKGDKLVIEVKKIYPGIKTIFASGMFSDKHLRLQMKEATGSDLVAFKVDLVCGGLLTAIKELEGNGPQ
jgi:CheY-like chemotaxis protein